jgi:hypothetical protein
MRRRDLAAAKVAGMIDFDGSQIDLREAIAQATKNEKFLVDLSKAIMVVAIRLSFVASIWIFTVDADRWLAMCIFGILSFFTIKLPSKQQ